MVVDGHAADLLLVEVMPLDGSRAPRPAKVPAGQAVAGRGHIVGDEHHAAEWLAAS